MARRKSLKQKIVFILAILNLIVAILFIIRPDLKDRLSSAAIELQPGQYRVTEFVDGDTIAIDMNGHTEKIRFIGVDTPETHKPNTPVQCFGPQAAEHTKTLIGSQPIRLAADPKDTDRDRYGRLLRYIYLPDNTLVNKQLIIDGYGFYYPYFPFSKKNEFSAAQAEARSAHRGLWASCQPTPTDGGGWNSNTASS